MDDGLMLNLVQSNNVVKKKKPAKKSSKFLKKKLNQKKKGSTPFKPKIKTKNDKVKKEVDQNKEISTIQSEFSSGLDDVKDSKKNKNDLADKSGSKEQVKNKFKSNDKQSSLQSFKPTKSNFNDKQGPKFNSNDKQESNLSDKQTTKINSNDKKSPIANQTNSKLNQDISLINDEFADGLVDFKVPRNDKRSDRNERPNLKRKFNDEGRSDFRDFRDSKSQKRFDRPSTSSARNEDNFSTDKLKDEFNDLFAFKRGNEPKKSNSKFNDKSDKFRDRKFNDKFGDKFSDRKSNNKFGDDKFRNKFGRDSEEKGDRNDFISNCFSSNPEIPEIKLKNLVDENKEDVFSDDKTFESLNERLHPHLISCLSNRLNIDKMTNVQSRSIPFILDRTDCLIKSVTGSGKTLVYCVPIIQILQEKTPKITRTDGIYALIIVPTRELVLQCYNILESLSKVKLNLVVVMSLLFKTSFFYLGFYLYCTWLFNGYVL